VPSKLERGGTCVDGTSVYTVSLNGNAIAAFSRNTSTGLLTQLAGTVGCVSDTR
jgi:hypothetical protein